jgi:hypothetical protein
MVHRILRKYGVAVLIVPAMLVGVSLSAIALAPSVTTAAAHGARSATLADYDQSITPQNPSFSVVENGSLSGPAGTLQTGATDTDTNANCCNVTADPSNPPTSGSVTFDSNGDGGFTYTPDAGFTGSDSFGFILTDTDGNTAGGTVTVDVNPVTVAASDSTYVTSESSTLSLLQGTLQTNDSDNNPVSGAVCCTATLAGKPTDGTVSVNSNGGFNFTPTSGFVGTGSFSYQLTDSDGNVSAPASVSVDVNPGIPQTNTAIIQESPPAASPSIPVTFVAQVTQRDPGPAPTGSVTFTWYRTGGKSGGGPLTGTMGVAPLAQQSNGYFEASFTTSNGDLEAGVVDGSIRVTATYSGDANNGSSAGQIIYFVEATCDEGQWPAVSNGIPTVTSTGTPEGYYIGQSNGWYTVYVAAAPTGATMFTGYIKTNGLIIDLSATKNKKGDHFLLNGQRVVQYSINDKAHLDGFTFYAGCGSNISFNLKINGAPAPKSLIFLGPPTSNATKTPVVFKRTS